MRKVLLVLLVAACGTTAEDTSSSTQAATSSNGVYQNGLVQNGVYQNGLTTNGVYQNGVYQNGVYQNGVYQNGVYQNGVYQNGVYQNGVYQNGVYQNGVYQNGVYQNGVYQNGVYQNGVYQNGLWTSGLWSNAVWQVGTNATALRTNPYTRQFMQYVYACAMPGAFDPAIGTSEDDAAKLAPGYYSTSLDPNNGTLACNASQGCDDPYYTCDQTTNRCVVQLDGAVGLGVNADGSTWWDTGQCDETCQRWISACVLARTNAYGVHVDISMRAPADAPTAVKNALWVTSDERSGYTLREGAYFGNIFETQPVSPIAAGSGSAYSGDPGPLVAAPQVFACAGPGSNIPEITKRFCSSQGDQAVINVPGTCLPTGAEQPVCSGEDSDPASPTFGAIQDCYTSTNWANQTPYQQVVTVYLKKPISVCGNAVCEADEDQATSTAFCPSDCHAGSWAHNMYANSGFGLNGHLAVDSSDGSSYVTSDVYNSSTLTFEQPSGAVVVPDDPLNYNDRLVIAKYAADGTIIWANRYIEPSFSSIAGVITTTVAVDHSLVLFGLDDHPWYARVAADGALAIPPTTYATPGPGTGLTSTVVRTDAAGNVFVAGMFYTSTGSALPTLTIGGTTLTGGSTDDNAYVAKLSPQGQPLWAAAVNAAPTQSRVIPRSMTIDGNGDAIVAGYDNQNFANPAILYKLHGADGTVAWGIRSGLTSLETVTTDLRDPSLSVYVTGGGLVAKVNSDGTVAWQKWLGSIANMTGAAIDPRGDLVFVSDYIWPIDFGAGVFNPYHVDHLAVTALAPDGSFVWSKHVPTILGSTLSTRGGIYSDVQVDAGGHVVVLGTFAGSVQVDDRMLVTSVPETNLGYEFIGSFSEPSPDDHTITIGDAIDAFGNHLSTIPNTISVEATSSAGASVFYMVPTAIDSGGAGTNVTCSPPPNTVFPIGTTVVTCTATNAVGASATAQFDVVVHDALGPTLTGVPADFTASSSTVTYPLPTAIDQIGGAVPVTCSPASGTTFPNGATVVTCSASDAYGNKTDATFTVTVTAPVDATPPAISVPSPITAAASGPNGATVTYSASATDNLDGAVTAACAPASGSMFPIGTTTVTCTASDAHGNQASASFAVVVADQTPPTVLVPSVLTAEAASASGATITFAAGAADNVDGSDATTCAPASGSVFALGTTTVTCGAHDAAGNTAAATFTVTITDTTPPAITVPTAQTVTATGPSTVVSYSVSASDLVDGAGATTCSPASGSGFPLGSTTVSCTATDSHNNTATQTFVVQVVAQWSGVLQPINGDGSSVFHLGSTVPVKFQLTGGSATITNALATLSLVQMSGSVTGSVLEAVSTSNADSGNQFRYDASSNQYVFNMSTRGLSVGTWQLRIDLHDGVTRTINISLK